MASSHLRRIGDLAYLVDTLVAPLLNLSEMDKTDAREAVELGLLESFLWIGTGVALGLFPAAEAQRALDHYLGDLIPTFSKYAEREILATDMVTPVEQYLRTKQLKQLGEASAGQRHIFLAAFDAAAEFLCRFTVRSLISTMRFKGEESWSKALKLNMQVGLLAEATSEYDRTSCNELTNYAAGVLNTLEHMLSFEALDEHGEQTLVRTFRKMRNWSLAFEKSVVRDRFMHLVTLIQDQANNEASRFQGNKISADTLANIASERIRIWQASSGPTTTAVIASQGFSVSVGASEKENHVHTSGQNGVDLSLEPPDKQVQNGGANGRYIYHASAFGLAGELLRPIRRVIPAQAKTVLSPAGGRSYQRAEDFRLEGILSFRDASAEVAGSYDENHRLHATHAWAVVEGLNVGEIITADRIVSRLSVYASDANGEPSFDITGSYFENLRIAGQKVDVRLDTLAFHDHDTYSKISQAYRSRKADRLFLGSRLADLGDKDLQSLEHTYSALSDVIKLAREEKKQMERPRMQETYALSAANHLDLEKQIGRSELLGFGSIICVPKFGVIRLAEIMVESSKRQLNILRVDFAESQGSIAVGYTEAAAPAPRRD